ncbi:MAG: cysteine-rich CWC family protein [Pseudobdellovibrio sp.]
MENKIENRVKKIICSECQQTFTCEGSDIKSKDDFNCWCKLYTLNSEILKNQDSCLCPSCLNNFCSDENKKDTYFDAEGLMVFTKHYLLKRGFCCGNNCKHCPY